MNNDFDKVYNLYTNDNIPSLRKYKYIVSNMNIFEFEVGDFEKVKKLINLGNTPSIYIIKEGKEVYIGQTDNIKDRLKNHIKTKKFITEETIIYVITSEGFNKNICLEVESQTIQLFKNSVYDFKMHNNTEINNSYLGSSDKLNSNGYMNFFREVYFLLGFKLKQRSKEEASNDSDEDLFYFKEASMKVVEDGYLLLKGSKIFMESYGKYQKPNSNISKIRDELIQENSIKDGVILKDLFWKYPSAPAVFVGGKSYSGYVVWKNKDNKTLDDCIERAN